MLVRLLATLPIALVAGLLCSSPATAAPWQKLIPFKPVEADDGANYDVKQSHGPWMIMATTFRGKDADVQARELVLELRRKHKLPAYLHRQTFDYTKQLPGRGLTPEGRQKVMRHADAREIDEVAVLVGEYASVDDPDAKKTLTKIKNLRPDSLKPEIGRGTSQSYAEIRRGLQSALPDSSERKTRGPMRQAFVTTNPLLPPEYFSSKGIDKFVLDMNKGVEHSLLDCKGRYTVKVATFTGKVIIDQTEIQKIKRNDAKLESKLDEAVEKAHKLTASLREKGYDAYEFHDRFSSIVTVGSFNSVGTPRADGKTEINPQIHKIMEAFKAKQVNGQLPNGTTGAMRQQRVAGINLDIQPVPVEVPRRSISADYQQSALR